MYNRQKSEFRNNAYSISLLNMLENPIFSIETHIYEAHMTLAKEVVTPIADRIDWETTKCVWPFLKRSSRFAALTIRRLQLTGKPNPVIATELLSDIDTGHELVFYPGSVGSKLVRRWVSEFANQGGTERDG